MKISTVSIIVPVYNVENYIDRCIESCLEQTYRDIEIVLAVGMCDDNSLQKCIEWKKKDDRIIILENVKKGVGNARNSALRAASGEYIVFVDSDDYIAKDYVEKLCVPLIEDSSINVTCCGFNYHDKNGEIRPGWKPLHTGKKEVNCDVHTYVKYISWCCACFLGCRRQWFIDNELFMFGKSHEDNAFQLMLGANTDNIYLIPEYLYYYDISNQSSVMHNLNNRVCFLEAMEYAIDYYKRHNIFERYVKDIGNACLSGIITISAEFEAGNEFDEKAYAFLGKYFPEMKNELKKTKEMVWNKYALYGLGKDGEEYLDSADIKHIVCIIDNNPELNDVCVRGIQIISYDEFRLKYKDVPILISSRKYFYEIACKLKDDGIEYRSAYKGFYK